MAALTPYLVKIQKSETLSTQDMTEAMTLVMEGRCSDAEIAAFLMGLSVRGERPEEIAGAAQVMRSKALTISAPEGAVDCCGTGGDHSGSYNISTAVALVSAACGVPVAKHGNRASSSKSGTADVLEALGVNLDLSYEKLETALEQIGFAFLMAPRHHEAVKHVLSVRKALGIRTLFNLLGPLANPAGTRRQLIGVYDRKWVLPVAETLRHLGMDCAWVVHGADGMDEITTTAKTFVAKLDGDLIHEEVLTPEDFGLPRCKPEALRGGNAAINAEALLGVLEGQTSAYRDIVVVNTAAVLIIAGKFPSGAYKEAAAFAAAALDEGKAIALFKAYKDFTQNKSVRVAS
ncbi:MAG: anthranilate phosphoribosyltransferase [Rhodospirillales bacterium]|nr:anthranilate phosphoribosyltransferase [Alphaproteobacteria bacterium]MCB9977421.1 anthranilate phosphoribosyltransferase [Rhodospirillales bacterium]